jgi:toxin ParE1/3/4
MKLRWTGPAAEDLTRICDHFRHDSGESAALRIARSVLSDLSVLVRFPNSGRVGRKPGTRELVVARLPYIAIYRIHGGAVEVLRVLHGKQRWP